MGYYIGRAKFAKVEDKRQLLFLAFFAPYILHFIYNSIFLVQQFALYLAIPFMLFLWWFGLTRVKYAHSIAMHQFRRKAKIK